MCTHTVIYYAQRPDHNTGSFKPYYLQTMCRFFNVQVTVMDDILTVNMSFLAP